MDFSIIIPARYASSRLPAKLLKDINGKTLIEHTYSNALKSNASRVIIATDDERIRQVALNFGAEVCMTNHNHSSGTSRLSQVVSDLSFEHHEIIVNLQGDEPMMAPESINQVASNLATSSMSVATLCEKINSQEEYFDENCVKVVYNSRGKALYFSRSPVPAFRSKDNIDLDLCFRHVGLYAYKVGFLKDYSKMEMSSLEIAEKLETVGYLTSLIRTQVGGYSIDESQSIQEFEASWKLFTN